MPETIVIPIPPNGKVEISDAGEYRILHLKPQDPLARKLFPHYVERCQDFIEATNSDTDPIWVAALLYNNFHNATNLIHCLVALDKDEKIAAHSLSYVENTYKLGLHCHVLQLWKSHSNPKILDPHEGLKMVEEWAKNLGIKTMIISVDPNGGLVRLYEHYEWKKHRAIMIREIT